MKKIIAIASLVVITQLSFAQKSFFECNDSLRRNPRFYMKWNDSIIGKEMPVLSLQTISGEKIETKDLIGKVVVINLWFTGCHPCIAELPALNKLVKEYKDKDVVFLGLSTDSKEMLDSYFFPKYKFDFTIIPNALNIVEQKMGRTGFPTTYIFDKKGQVRDAWIGGAIDKTAETIPYLRAKPIIDELLAIKQ